MRKLKSVILSTSSTGNRWLFSTIFRGEQALAAAFAEFYELEDMELTAHELGKLVVKLQTQQMWRQKEQDVNGA